MPGECEEVGHIVSKWERDIKEHTKSVTRRSLRVKRFKEGKIKLKGWWDEEVAREIGDRKRENRKQSFS